MNVKLLKEILKAQPKTFIAIALLILLNVSLYLFASGYLAPRLESLQSKRLEMRAALTRGAATDTTAVYRQGENDLKLWRARILKKKEFARFLGTLFEAATNNSLAFKGVTYKVSQLADQDLTAYSLDLNVSGKYAAVKSFISDLGRMHEMVTIDNIAINNPKVTEDVVELKVQLTVYLRMEEQ